MSLVSKQYLLALSTGEPIVLFNLGERLVGTFFRSCLIRCLFSLGAEYHCSDVVTGVGTGSPSEIGGIFIWLGIIPGVLLRVFRLCTLGVCRMSSGCVGFVDVCGCWSDGWSANFSVLFANIFANAAKAVVCLPGFRASNPCNFLIASSKSFATLVAESIGVSTGSSQCWG